MCKVSYVLAASFSLKTNTISLIMGNEDEAEFESRKERPMPHLARYWYGMIWRLRCSDF